MNDELTTIHIGPTEREHTVPITAPTDPTEWARWQAAGVARKAAGLSTTVGQDYLVDAEPSPANTVRMYLDMAAIGHMFNVSAATVSQWRTRYADSYPFPAPDAVIGRTPGWAPARERAIRDWEASRPGQGAGGGRPRKS